MTNLEPPRPKGLQRMACPYCDETFHYADLYRRHVHRSQRTGWCMGT